MNLPLADRANDLLLSSRTATASIRNLNRTPASRSTGRLRRSVSALVCEVAETCSFQPWPSSGAPGGSATNQYAWRLSRQVPGIAARYSTRWPLSGRRRPTSSNHRGW
jgi:hypothetical protein